MIHAKRLAMRSCVSPAALALIALCFQHSTVYGSDAQGNYMRGGGVGSVSCPIFLSVMTDARRVGGTFPSTSVEATDARAGTAAAGMPTGRRSAVSEPDEAWLERQRREERAARAEAIYGRMCKIAERFPPLLWPIWAPARPVWRKLSFPGC